VWKLIDLVRTESLVALVEAGLLSRDFTMDEPPEERPEPGYEKLMRHDAYRRERGALRQVGWSG